MDAISGKEGTIFVTIDGRRFAAMNVVDFKADVEILKTDVPIVGDRNVGDKPAGWKGKVTMSYYYNQPHLRDAISSYVKTGKMPVMEAELTNDDPASRVGRQTVVLKGVSLNGVTLAMLDSADNSLKENIDGSFRDYEIPTKFTPLPGME